MITLPVSSNVVCGWLSHGSCESGLSVAYSSSRYFIALSSQLLHVRVSLTYCIGMFGDAVGVAIG